MRISKLKLNKVKSFDSEIVVDFKDGVKLYAFSGKNGSGKSTILKSISIIQKLHFCRLLENSSEDESAKNDALRFLTSSNSSITLELLHDNELCSICASVKGGDVILDYVNKEVIDKVWNLESPKDLILYVDASKGFSEETLSFDELNINKNSEKDVFIESILRPERLFYGVYRQLVKDYIHGRLIPGTPDRLLYHRVASSIFTKLIPGVQLKNFSGNHKPGEFVLLGKANSDNKKPLYDVRDFSSGEKALLSTLVFLCLSKSVCALIIDEPENHFHEGLLMELMNMLHELCDEGGLLKWAKSNTKIKSDWLSSVYKGHNLSQVIYSTHSKSLIYKTFALGENYIVDSGVSVIDYNSAERKLREIGLSTVNSKIIFVEGTGDSQALEHIVKGKSIIIKPLNGASEVIETFEKLAQIRSHLTGCQFAFLVDSDNKPDEFFEKIKKISPDFFQDSFIKLNRHEIENYLLDPEIIRISVHGFLKQSGEEHKTPTAVDIKSKILEFGKESIDGVLKKEAGLAIRYALYDALSDAIWGNKNFSWKNADGVVEQIQSHIFDKAPREIILEKIKDLAAGVYKNYEALSEDVVINRCDGKQVLGKICGHYSAISGVKADKLKKAIIKNSFEKDGTESKVIADSILKCFV